MSPEPASAAPETLSLVVFSGNYERVHYALALAAAAAAMGAPVTMLFTGEAIRALARPADDGAGGWRALAAGGGRTGDEVDDDYTARGVAGLEELLSGCAKMGVRIIVCEMGLRVVGLDRSALRGDVPVEEGGLITFLASASPAGAITFV